MFNKALIMLCLATPVFAATQGSQASVASTDLSSQGLSELVRGSGHLLMAGNQASIAAIETVGDVSFITLRAAGQSGTVTIRVARTVVGQALIGTGQLVQVVGIGSGTLLTSSGRLLAFLPNELGKSLVYSNRLL